MDDKGFVQISRVKIADEDNIVFLEGKKDFNPKGSARPLLVGNEFWRSPEQQVGYGIGQAADVWSFGVMVSSFRRLLNSTPVSPSTRIR